jgi:hypothetical protein
VPRTTSGAHGGNLSATEQSSARSAEDQLERRELIVVERVAELKGDGFAGLPERMFGCLANMTSPGSSAIVSTTPEGFDGPNVDEVLLRSDVFDMPLDRVR